MRTYKRLPNGYNSDVKMYWSLSNDNIVTYRMRYQDSTVVIATLENDTLAINRCHASINEGKILIQSIILGCPSIADDIRKRKSLEEYINHIDSDTKHEFIIKLKEPLYSAYWQFIKEQFNDLSNN